MAKTPLAQSQYSSWAGRCKRSLSTENSSQQQKLMGWIVKYRPGNKTKEQMNAFLPHWNKGILIQWRKKNTFILQPWPLQPSSLQGRHKSTAHRGTRRGSGILRGLASPWAGGHDSHHACRTHRASCACPASCACRARCSCLASCAASPARAARRVAGSPATSDPGSLPSQNTHWRHSRCAPPAKPLPQQSLVHSYLGWGRESFPCWGVRTRGALSWAHTEGRPGGTTGGCCSKPTTRSRERRLVWGPCVPSPLRAARPCAGWPPMAGFLSASAGPSFWFSVLSPILKLTFDTCQLVLPAGPNQVLLISS